MISKEKSMFSTQRWSSGSKKEPPCTKNWLTCSKNGYNVVLRVGNTGFHGFLVQFRQKGIVFSTKTLFLEQNFLVQEPSFEEKTKI